MYTTLKGISKKKQIKNWAKDLDKDWSWEDAQKDNKHMKDTNIKCSLIKMR